MAATRGSRSSGARHIDKLPVDAFIEPIREALNRSRAVVVTAAPGAGKTTRIPPALVGGGRVIVLQPRRMAARAIARRVADERGWVLGREVGWQVRRDRNFSADTRLLVVTEGILTARLQSDPLISDFQTIVIDEFHERSIHGDVAVALARQAWRARPDLRLVVMSATLDAGPVASFLDDAPVIEVPGRLHPLEIAYAPAQPVADAAVELLQATSGTVLSFLPGAAEIARAIAAIEPRLPPGTEVLPLHGSLDASEQDNAIRPAPSRRIIVSTNIAETSLTVPGVTAVIDAGLQKVARYDPERGIDRLEAERITADAADQRAGRAGRVGPGLVRRLWDQRDRLRPHREPEIHRIDLSAAALDIIAWGGDPRTFEWFEAPRLDAIEAALDLLKRLGLVTGDSRLTALGRRAHALPMHPRLARIVTAGDHARPLVQACEFLANRLPLPPRTVSTSSDLLAVAGHGDVDEVAFRRAILAGYPDRVAKRRRPRSPEVLLSSGAGATIGRESGVVDAEFLVAVDVTNGIIRIASAVDRDWLEATGTETIHRFDAGTGSVKAALVTRYHALVLSERPIPANPDVAARLLAEAWLARGPAAADLQLIRRLRFAGHAVDVAALVHTAAGGARTVGQIQLATALGPSVVRELAHDAPERLTVPSGRQIRLEYDDDGTVTASVKLQELFGLAETPRVGRQREPVLLALLAPNGRPVQLTRDLRSFWDRTYPEIRKELRGQYPKHPWPEDPWHAVPTHRPKPR